jgi:hypothetical protein
MALLTPLVANIYTNSARSGFDMRYWGKITARAMRGHHR